MSYEIVKSIGLKQDENGFWYAEVTSACNNVRPHYYSKWKYCKKDNFATKEELQKEILLDFYYGNFHGGTSTKYGKFLQFLGGSWGCENENSRACKTYHFYDKLDEKLRKDYLAIHGSYNPSDEVYKDFAIRCGKLRLRQDRELKNALYKEFLEFKPTCKPTILRLWRNNEHQGFVRQSGRRKDFYIEDSYNWATKYTNTAKLGCVKTLAEKFNFKVELIEV